MPDNPQELRKAIEWRVLLITAALAAVFLIAGENSWMWGIIVGALCSLLHFRTICLVAERVVDMAEGKARLSTTISYAARYIFNAGVLAYSYFLPTLSFPAVVIGLLLVKLVIITGTLQERWSDMLSTQLKNIQKKLERRD